ncbi:MAG: twin-arginine translocase subunit TatC [Kiritimatiellae bacterium]|nr:twin-arginine translocase subunit TatC [Kiritimatiellia bacterium]
MPQEKQNIERVFERDEPKPFLQHLEELRRTILWSLAVLILAMLVALPFAPVIFRLLCAPLAKITAHPEIFLRSLEITGAFAIVLRLLFWGGLILSAPVILFLIGGFVFPGLTASERKTVRLAGVFAFFLFMLGVALGYFLTLPIALKVFFALHGWLGIQAEWTATSYTTFCMQLLLLFGLAFELPVAIMVLGYFNVVSSSFLRSKRRHAVVVILILAMILTPGPDVFSQLIMALPMFLLYEISVWIVRLFERRAAQGAESA